MAVDPITRRFINATSDEELAIARRALDRALTAEEIADILQECVYPQGGFFAELAGSTSVTHLFENPRFAQDPDGVVHAWINAIAGDDKEIDRGLVAEAIASLANDGLLGTRAVKRIWRILCRSVSGQREARTALERRIDRFALTGQQLLQLVQQRHAAFAESVARAIAMHPAATPEVWRALLGTGFMNLRPLSEVPGARKEPVVRSRLFAETWDPAIRMALCFDAKGGQFAELWLGLLELDKERALNVLQAASPEQLKQIPREAIAPLLRSSRRETRLVALTVIGKTQGSKAMKTKEPSAPLPEQEQRVSSRR